MIRLLNRQGVSVLTIVSAMLFCCNSAHASSGAEWTAPDQEAAKEFAARPVELIVDIKDEIPYERSLRLLEQGLSIKDMASHYFLLDSPIIKKQEDRYGPARFMHAKHARLVRDCAVCHHYRPKDSAAKEINGCSACHQDAFDPRIPDRTGLKAAYHLQCMDCHREMAKGPLSCTGCHDKKIPDHVKLVKLADKPEPSQVTEECLRCHENQGRDMLKTAHWLWRGPSTYTVGRSKEVEIGKGTIAFNNY